MDKTRFRLTSFYAVALGVLGLGLAGLFSELTDPPQKVYAQPVNCQVSGTLSGTGFSAVIDNRKTQCYNFQLSYVNTGFSGVSIQLEQAPDNGGVPGTWAAFTGSSVVVDGANPQTSTNAALIGVHSAAAFVRVNLATATGTGKLTFILWGASGISAKGGGGSGGGSVSPGAVIGQTVSATYNAMTIPGSPVTIFTQGSGQGCYIINGTPVYVSGSDAGDVTELVNAPGTFSQSMNISDFTNPTSSALTSFMLCLNTGQTITLSFINDLGADNVYQSIVNIIKVQ